jgi:hypothetical protein
MRERNLGTNGSSSARPRLNERAQQRFTGFLVLTAAVEDMFSVRDKIVPRLVCRGTHTGHMGASRPSASGSRSGTQPFGPRGRKVDESSTLPDQFTPLKQIGNLPDGACPARPGRRPVPARRRNVARTCDVGARLRLGLALPSPADSATRCARAMPAAGINGGRLPFSPDWGESFQGRGDTEGSAQ